MSLEKEIGLMYREIVSHGGDFGDPIVTSISFDPWLVLESGHLSENERNGAIVGIMVHLMAAIDNSVHAEVISSKFGRLAKDLFESDLANEVPYLRSALAGFFQSEDSFAQALRPIYWDWVVPTAKA